jgi:carboxypeptidase PM20D1
MIKRILIAAFILLLIFIGVLIFNTQQFTSKQIGINPIDKSPGDEKAVERLSSAIKIKTISYDDPEKFDEKPFLALHKLLAKNYPIADSLLEKEVVNKYSLLYHWEGRNPNLKPAIFMAHMDVVPVEEESLKKWEVDPFSGAIMDGFVWGRGTLDDKINVIAIMEAIESLMKEGYAPERGLYIAFGHDEEISGKEGAAKIVQLLKSRNIDPEFVLDEGGILSKGLVPGIKSPVALVGVAEKGYTTVVLHIELEGGHSSMPQKETPITVLSKAVNKIVDNPFKATITPPVKGFIEYIGPEMPFLEKMIFANSWLFEPLIINIYQKTNSGNALVRTTTAPTIFKSGLKDNILPTEANASVNFRVLPGTTSKDVLEHVRKVIADDRIKISVGGFANEPSPVSGTNTIGFNAINKSIRETFPGTLVSPYLVLGATDSRYFAELTENIYRFAPFSVTSEDLNRIHGINERISIDDYHNSISFYQRLIKNMN